MRLVSMLPLALVLGLAACGPGKKAAETKPAETAAAAPEAAAPPSPLSEMDLAAIKATLPPDTTLELLNLDANGAAKASGEVKGYAAPAYAVLVAPGQTLNVAFKTTSTNLYMNVVDSADTSGAAVHRGEVDGATANLTPTKPTIYVIQPFQPRATARRDEAGSFEIEVTRK